MNQATETLPVAAQDRTVAKRQLHAPSLPPNCRRAVGYCDRPALATIRSYDRHTVEINGKKGILFTFHLLIELPRERNLVVVVFVDAEEHAAAPASVQRVIDEMTWKYDSET